MCVCPADGRLAVNLGSIALVYQPRFEGRERYGFTACSVPCPEMDSTIVDLQRFPGKVRVGVREAVADRERGKVVV